MFVRQQQKHSPRLHNHYPFIDEMKAQWVPRTNTHTQTPESEIPNGGKKARKPFLSTRCVYLRSGNLCNKISVLILKVERSASRNRQTETSKRSKRTLLVLKIRHWRYYCRFILGSRFTFFFTSVFIYRMNCIALALLFTRLIWLLVSMLMGTSHDTPWKTLKFASMQATNTLNCPFLPSFWANAISHIKVIHSTQLPIHVSIRLRESFRKLFW